MGRIKKLVKNFLTNKQIRFAYLSRLGVFHLFSDEWYLKRLFEVCLGRKLNLDSPSTFNEKMQWLKLYDRKPKYSIMADKYAVKKYVADKIGEEYVIQSLGGPWKSFSEIDFGKLPKQFVLKTNHDSGGVVVCKDKNGLDKQKANKLLSKHLKRNYYYKSREWPYKNVKPCIFAEEYVKDGNNDFLPVYKFLCFHGEPRIIQTIQNDKQPNESIDYFDTEWNLLKLKQGFPNSVKPFEKPEKLKEMCEIARKLSKEHAFLRVDLYIINNEIKFSEFTFYSDAGLSKFEPESWDITLGDWIKLPI